MHGNPSVVLKVCALSILAAMAGCGGGGGDDLPSQSGGSSSNDWTAGVFLPEQTFFARCAIPRSDVDPGSGQPLFADTQGSTLDENNWLRSWTNNSYLWYDEILDQDPALFADPIAYFDELRTTELTPSGNLKDRFHFAIGTEEWLAESQSGISFGYGMELVVLSAIPPREVVVSFTQPGSPATVEAIARGTRITMVDGVDLINGATQAMVDVINAGLFPETADESHSFELLDPGSATPRTVTLTSAEITSAPVQNVSTVTSPQGATVGYLHFSAHIATAESALLDAITQLQAASIEDLVIDLRYNGGGFLAIASQLAYMIAGATQAGGQTFEQLEFNDKYPANNPVNGTPLEPLPFLDETIGLSAIPAEQSLPTLDLSRVFVLTGARTCSASESIINSLRGIGVEVIQVGAQTCGKPYGFYPTDNCGTTFFSIQFRGINAAGFGDYADGFTPANGGTVTDTDLPGCIVGDDFDNSLGSESEARLAAALAYRDTGTCPASAAPASLRRLSTTGLPIETGATWWRSNRILPTP